jgi:ubiquinone/menaquinone biosynthesis C-methylase UbiE
MRTVTMREGSSPDSPADYRGFDFAALWTGRERVTQVELRIVRDWLDTVDLRRVLEIGTGFGRLTPTLRRAAAEYVGLDADPGGLGQASSVAGPEGRSARWVLGNVFHLPFDAESITAAALVRVTHHLADFGAVAREVFRVLVPGGSVLISTAPRPTVGTLVEDVKGSLTSTSGAETHWATFAPGPVAQIRGPPRPVYVAASAYYREKIRTAGFEIRAERGSGLEEFSSLLPDAFLARAGAQLGRFPIFPLKWYEARKPGSRSTDLAPERSILSCPKCHTHLGENPNEGPTSLRCSSCGHDWGYEAGFRDLRWPRPTPSPP